MRGGRGDDYVEGSNDPDTIHGNGGGDSILGGHDCCDAYNVDAMYGESGRDDIVDLYDPDHDLACGGTQVDNINVADGDESDLVYDKDSPNKDAGDGWVQQDACTIPDGGDTVLVDSLQALLDDTTDDVLELLFTLLDLIP